MPWTGGVRYSVPERRWILQDTLSFAQTCSALLTALRRLCRRTHPLANVMDLLFQILRYETMLGVLIFHPE